MSMEKTIFLVIFLFCMSNILHSQVFTHSQAGLQDLVIASKAGKTSQSKEKSIIGNPYLIENFLRGEIKLQDGSLFTEVPIRYNIYAKDIEFISDEEDTLSIYTPLKVEYVRFGDKEFRYLIDVQKFGKSFTIQADYYEVIVSGKLQLLCKNYKSIESDTYATNYMGGGGTGKEFYVTKQHYYLRNDGEAPIFIKNKKTLFSFFDDNKSVLQRFYKEHNINIKDPRDLKKIVVFYNSL